MRRPAFYTAICFATGTLLQTYVNVPVACIWISCLLALAGATAAFCLNTKYGASAILMVLLVLLGMLYLEVRGNLVAGNHFLHVGASHESVFSGTLVSEPEQLEKGWRAQFEVTSIARADTIWHTSGRVLVRVADGIPLTTYGDSLVIKGLLELPSPARNPGGFDYRTYLKNRGIRGLLYVSRDSQIVDLIEMSGVWWMRAVLPVRQTIQGAIDQNLSGGPAALLKGILLGDKRAVPDDIRLAFTRCGINHVLAVSGLHVGLIAAVVFFGLRLLGAARCLNVLATIVVLVLYAFVTGLPPSVIRACVMASLVLLGQLGRWDTDGWNALGVAGLFGLVIRPMDIMDVGFQLSFVATAGIMLLYQPILDRMPKTEKRWINNAIWAPLAVSIAAQLATMPLIVTYFGLVSVIGLVANLIVVPLIGASAALGVLTILCYPITFWGSTLLNGANWALLEVALYFAHQLAKPEWASFWLPALPVYQWVLYGLVITLFLPMCKIKVWRFAVCTGILLVANYAVWVPFAFPRHALEIYVLDVGQGDSIFLRFPNGKTMLVDGGIRTQHQDMGARVVLPFLRSKGISKIDVMVGSHAHSDHIGGLISVLENIPVAHYLDSGQPANTWTSREIYRLLEKYQVEYQAVAAGDSLVGLGGAGGLVLHPVPAFVDQEASHGLNDGSVVLRLDYQGIRFLLTGDIEKETDAALLRWGERLHAHILKAAHHGSRTSSSEGFMHGVSARWVAVSCGIRNKFRHPSPEVITRYKAQGLKVYRTDLSGAIRFQIEKGGVSVKTWLN